MPTSFTVTCADRVHTVKALAGRVADGWSQRSCGKGCKGHRWYEWAWIATGSPTHWVLVRRSPDDHHKVTFFYCHAPNGATLATLVRIAGRRWPVETCLQAAKSILGIDAHQVRLWHSWQRHTTLTLLAAAILAVATAAPAETDTDQADLNPGQDTSTDPTDLGTPPALPAQPGGWRETGTLPVRPDEPPPADLGMIKITVAEARRLLAIAATTTAKLFHLRWSEWRRGTKPEPDGTTGAPVYADTPPYEPRPNISCRLCHKPGL